MNKLQIFILVCGVMFAGTKSHALMHHSKVGVTKTKMMNANTDVETAEEANAIFGGAVGMLQGGAR